MTVDDGSVVVTVMVDDLAWTQANDLEDASSEDKVYVVDAVGTVVFGDGIHGQRPRDGSQVTVTWRRGGGDGGDSQLSFSTSWPLRENSYQIASGRSGLQINPVLLCGESESGVKRVRYFTGQLLSANDLQTEQQYFRDKLRRHNRFLHGHGVVAGLEVSVSQEGTSSCVVVSSGYGISPEGEELFLRRPLELKVDAPISPQYVTLRYVEVETDPVPTMDRDGSTPSRIEERVQVCTVDEPESSGGVTVGRIVLSGSGWVVDGEFSVERSI